MKIKPAKYDNLTPNERRLLRESYVVAQDGLCYWCNQPLSGPPSTEVSSASINLRLFPTGFMKHPVHLQHDHVSGLTEGAVHARCNAYMWQYHGR